ncbi:hypothetical protein PMZ80_011101 [Knufia obscura]|uniref:Uncharacterized protein n=1 Tax=Knufia obscura TaxID=1635080 RepID=A0ABR0R7W0_9EURO|nr:hypothetical protein PMZ80_011101 [Knufia obscura]
MLPSITFTSLTLLAGTAHSLALANAPPSSSWQNACPAAVDGLISGTEINILAQQGERNATEALQAIEAKNPVDMTAFAAGKAVLVNDVMFGMTIRRYNQLIAPAGNAALAGLATYAAAQSTELALAQSLNGVPSHDSSILAMLVTDVTNGITLNQNNTELAADGCYSPLLQYLPAVVADSV